jgi:hypothetical protein
MDSASLERKDPPRGREGEGAVTQEKPKEQGMNAIKLIVFGIAISVVLGVIIEFVNRPVRETDVLEKEKLEIEVQILRHQLEKIIERSKE